MSKHNNIVQLEERDYDELMAMLSRSFQKVNTNYFSQGVGAYYQKTAHSMNANHAIKIDGKIAAVVGLFPMDYQLGETLLKCGGIGGVCVAHEFRGQKLMGILMDHVVEVIQTQGYDLAWLSGDRQRYRYYGWEKSGIENHFKIIKPNLNHTKIEKIEGANCQSFDLANASDVRVCREMYESQAIHRKWGDTDFSKRLTHRFAHSFILKNAEGQAVAYAYLNQDKSQAQEIVGSSLNAILTLLDCLVSSLGQLEIVLPYDQNPGFSDWLYENAQTHAISNARSWMICDLPKVINAASQMRPLSNESEGASIVVRLTDQCKSLSLSNKNARLFAQWVSDDVPHKLAMNAIELQQLLFSPPKLNRSLSMLLPVVMHDPLPLFLATADHC